MVEQNKLQNAQNLKFLSLHNELLKELITSKQQIPSIRMPAIATTIESIGSDLVTSSIEQKETEARTSGSDFNSTIIVEEQSERASNTSTPKLKSISQSNESKAGLETQLIVIEN